MIFFRFLHWFCKSALKKKAISRNIISMVTLGVQVINVQLFTDCLHNCLYPALYTNPYINIYICTYICNIHIYIHIFKYLSYSQWSFITITSLENPKPNSNFFVLSFVYTAGFFSVNDLQIEIKKTWKVPLLSIQSPIQCHFSWST